MTVARDALNLLTDQLIDEIADMAIRQSEQDLINDTHIPQLTAQLSEVEKSIMNITAAIEKGIASETLMNRLVQLEHEKKTLNKEIKAEEKFVYRIDRDQIVFWLSQFKYGNIEDEDFRRRLIDLLVNSVTVWDEPDGYKITTAYNLTSCKAKTFRVEKNPAAEEATGFDFGESECTSSSQATYHLRRAFSFHCKAYRSLILPLLSFKPDPLRWAPAWGRPVGGCFCPRKNIGFDCPFHVVAKFAL